MIFKRILFSQIYFDIFAYPLTHNQTSHQIVSFIIYASKADYLTKWIVLPFDVDDIAISGGKLADNG